MLLAVSRIRTSVRTRARVEIIPLIDVIFFLLATFVLFTLSMSLLRTIPLVFPHPSHDRDRVEPARIQVSGDGALFWNGESIDLPQLTPRLMHYKTQTNNPRIFITSDEHARLGAAVTVLDKIRKAGIESFSVETRPRAIDL